MARWFAGPLAYTIGCVPLEKLRECDTVTCEVDGTALLCLSEMDGGGTGSSSG